MKLSKKMLQRIFSIFLAVTIIFGVLPTYSILASAATNSTSVADPKSITEWMTEWFPKEHNRYSGDIFIDKSVYTASEIGADGSYLKPISNKLSVGTDNFNNDNFLVSLSAIGSNTEIIGYSATPTDTMLVLDLSNSMTNSNTVAMVKSANRAIEALLELNRHNRVGIVAYSGTNGSSNSAASTATVLLPLGRYTTTVTETEANVEHDIFLQVSYSGGTNIRVATERGGGVYDSNNRLVTKSKAVSGGTYMQNGIYTAYNQFPSGEDTIIPDGQIQSGTQRMPILVLMTDGAPTTATTNYANIGTSNVGKGYSSDATADVGFLTQLTASWTKAKLKEKYNGNDVKFYTLGVGTSNNAVATGVLNPSSTANSAAGIWQDFLDDGSVTLSLPASYTQNSRSYTLNKADNTVLTRDYVNQYWTANNAATMISAFEDIVEQIIIQSRYYATLVSSGKHELDGYISFTDEIGKYMEVKDIKGIHIGGNTLSTGDIFAKAMFDGTIKSQNGAYTSVGARLILALETRFNINETEAIELLNAAIANGFISYTAPTATTAEKFSHYVAWYADADNNYLAPYSATLKSVPNGAKYLVKSYIYLGNVEHSGIETEMMYTLVRVREDLATGVQIVDANLPAALLPMVTYTITVEGDTFTAQSLRSMTNNAEDVEPACLLFEVGLRDDINPYNISEKIDASYPKNQDGSYTFYTNRWRDDSGNEFTIPEAQNLPTGIYNHGLIGSTEAHFTPSIQNERYYYTTNTLVYVKDGNGYAALNAATKPQYANDTYYHEFRFVTVDNGVATLTSVFNPISQKAFLDAEPSTNNTWVIPAGTPKRYLGEEVHGIDKHSHKKANPTNTLGWSSFPKTVHELNGSEQGYHVFEYLGNNGAVTAVSEQGIKLSKTVTQEVTGAATEFTFDITLLNGNVEANYPTYIESTGEIGSVTPVGNVLTVKIPAGETIYIGGIDAGIEYSVVERYDPHYASASQNASSIVSNNTFNEVDFVNSPRGYGSLLVSKDVIHNFGNQIVPDALLNHEFDITVTFRGDNNDLNMIEVDGLTPTVENRAAIYTFALKDASDKLFTNIPENVTYTVTEALQNAAGQEDYGFSLDASSTGLSGTIVKDAQSHAAVINKYEQDSVTAQNIILTGNKTITPLTYNWQAGQNFQVALQPVNIGGNSQTAIGNSTILATLTSTQQGYTLKLSDALTEPYKVVGDYSYIIYEVYPDNPVIDIAYDSSFGLFTVSVTDNDADGKLEISNVTVHRDSANISGDANNGWTITKSFNNIYQAYAETFKVQKSINGTINNHQHDSGILFGLFESPVAGGTPAFYGITDDNGVATFYVPIEKSKFQIAKTYYLREVLPDLDNRIVGMTYDISNKYTVTIHWDAAASEPSIVYRTYAENATGTVIDIHNDNGAISLVIDNEFNENNKTNNILLGGNKVLKLSGNEIALRDNDSFKFELYATGADFVVNSSSIKLDEVVVTKQSGNDFNFAAINFDSLGTKHLVIREVKGDANKGITYDATEYHITVDVIKGEQATQTGTKTILKVDSVNVHKTGNGDTALSELAQGFVFNGAEFVNEYSINDEEQVVISLDKVLTDVDDTRHLETGEFEFGLYEGTNLIATAKNNLSGSFSFSALKFDSVTNKTYTVKEIIPDGAVLDAATGRYTYNGVTYDPTVYTVSVSVTDNGVGGLDSEVTYSVGSQSYNKNALEFKNLYNASSAKLTLSGFKSLEGRPLTANDRFTFELFKTDDRFIVSGNPIKSAVMQTPAANDLVSPYSIELEYEDGEEGIYHYVLSEQIPTGEKHGVRYDTREYHITVIVADNTKGQLVASIVSIVCSGMPGEFQSNALNFGNSYAAAPATFEISGSKEFKDGNLTQNKFEFELFDSNRNSLEIVKNEADGSFKFTDISLGTVGVHTFYIKEVIPAEATRDAKTGKLVLDRVSYDETEYKVTVDVYDDGLGNLRTDNVERYIGNESAASVKFTNIYTPKPTDLAIKVNVEKTVKNIGSEKIGPENFKFILEEILAAGNTTADALIDTNGKAEFTVNITEDDVDKTRKFKLYEVNEGKENITYSQKVYEIEIAVSLSDDNKLEAELKVDNVAATEIKAEFENIYDFTVVDDEPKTSDNSNLALWLALLFVSGGGFVFTSVSKKKEEN